LGGTKRNVMKKTEYTGAFLINVYDNLNYTTTKSIIDFINSEKIKCIIQNPPYVVR
jgi:hypothetical protein